MAGNGRRAPGILAPLMLQNNPATACQQAGRADEAIPAVSGGPGSDVRSAWRNECRPGGCRCSSVSVAVYSAFQTIILKHAPQCPVSALAMEQVYSADPGRAAEVADLLETGIVWINSPQGSMADLPFGGTKRSGVGRELGPYGIDEFVNKKLIYTPAPR